MQFIIHLLKGAAKERVHPYHCSREIYGGKLRLIKKTIWMTGVT